MKDLLNRVLRTIPFQVLVLCILTTGCSLTNKEAKTSSDITSIMNELIPRTIEFEDTIPSISLHTERPKTPKDLASYAIRLEDEGKHEMAAAWFLKASNHEFVPANSEFRFIMLICAAKKYLYVGNIPMFKEIMKIVENDFIHDTYFVSLHSDQIGELYSILNIITND